MHSTLDNPSERYSFEGNTLTLHVKRSPIVLLVILYFITALCFVGPILGFFIGFLNGSASLGSFIGIGFLGLIGFYLLRFSLWNTYGKEIIKIADDKVEYHGDFRYFQFNKKNYEINGVLYFERRSVGYEEDQMEVLDIICGSGDWQVNCSTKIPKQEMEQLLEEAKTAFNRSIKIPENTEE